MSNPTLPMCPKCKRYFVVGPAPLVCPGCHGRVVTVARKDIQLRPLDRQRI